MVVVLAVLAVSAEYATGMIRTTFVATPRRWLVFAARAAVTTTAVLAAGAVGVLCSAAVTRPIARHNGFRELLPLGRAEAGTVLYLALVGLLSLGVAGLVRDTAAAITTVVGLLYVFPLLGRFIDTDLFDRYAPLNAGLAVQATVGVDRLPIGPWAGLGVLAVWAGVALLAGAVRFSR
jgi:ABC-2 type transport system permease protein